MDAKHLKKVARFRVKVEGMAQDRAYSICSAETDGYPEGLTVKPVDRVAAAMKLWPAVKAWQIPGRMGRWCEDVLTDEAAKGDEALVRAS